MGNSGPIPQVFAARYIPGTAPMDGGRYSALSEKLILEDS